MSYAKAANIIIVLFVLMVVITILKAMRVYGQMDHRDKAIGPVIYRARSNQLIDEQHEYWFLYSRQDNCWRCYIVRIPYIEPEKRMQFRQQEVYSEHDRDPYICGDQIRNPVGSFFRMKYLSHKWADRIQSLYIDI